jgi:hypothetical protein
MIKVLCFKCGVYFEVMVDTSSPTQKCPNCRDT